MTELLLVGLHLRASAGLPTALGPIRCTADLPWWLMSTEELEPPRRCAHCDRRMVVQVLPLGWTARCSRHGEISSSTLVSDSSAEQSPDLLLEQLRFDAEHLWHPYSSMTSPAATRLVRSAQGVQLSLATPAGPELEVIDAMSSWWSAIHGYRNPKLDAAATKQLQKMSHVMFGGLTHEPAIALGRALLAATPDALNRVFFADSGSVSVEVAVKMCLQFQRGRGFPQRRRLLTIRGGYHGDTFAAMSICDPISGMHSMFRGTLAEQIFAPRPPAGLDRAADDPELVAWADQTRALAHAHRDELAAIVVEPILQGAGGMFIYSPHCLLALRNLADELGLLLVHDEIATGFGRVGTWWASDRAGVSPDILCVGKALTGGYLSLAAVVCTDKVALGVDRAESGVLAHGPTYMANPMACAIATASLEILAEQRWRDQVGQIERELGLALAPARDLPGVAEVRVVGAVGVIEMRQPVDVLAATEAALSEGVWIRPFGRLIYTMPPYICSSQEIATIGSAMLAAAKA